MVSRKRAQTLKVLSSRYKKIDADYSRCIYCGLSADTKDHIPPLYRAWTHNGPFYVVPACRMCNNLLSAAPVFKINERAAYLKKKYQRKFATIISFPNWSKPELEEMGYMMQKEIERNIELKEGIKYILDHLSCVEFLPY